MKHYLNQIIWARNCFIDTIKTVMFTLKNSPMLLNPNNLDGATCSECFGVLLDVQNDLNAAEQDIILINKDEMFIIPTQNVGRGSFNWYIAN